MIAKLLQNSDPSKLWVPKHVSCFNPKSLMRTISCPGFSSSYIGLDAESFALRGVNSKVQSEVGGI